MDYREKIYKTLLNVPTEDRLLCSAFGLCGESGEVAEYVKKMFFHGQKFDRANILKEIGDVRWYLELACLDLNITLNRKEALISAYDEDAILRLSLKLCKRAGWCADQISDYELDGIPLDRVQMEKRLNEIYYCLIQFATILNTTIEEIENINVDKLKFKFPESFI